MAIHHTTEPSMLAAAFSPAFLAAVGYDATSVSAGLVGSSLAAGRTYMSFRSNESNNASQKVPGRANLAMVFLSGAALSLFGGPFIARKLDMLDAESFVFLRLLLGLVGSMFIDLVLSKGGGISTWLFSLTLPQPRQPGMTNPPEQLPLMPTAQSDGDKTSTKG